MKIFVYEPYNYSYCGGAIVVIAQSEERAQQLSLDYEQKRHEQEGGNFLWHPEYAARFKKNDNDGDCWELTSEIDVSSDELERVVCFNYNHA